MYQYSPWPQMDPHGLSKILARHPHLERKLISGTHVFRQDEMPQYLYYLHDGVVKETLLDSGGKEKTLAIIEPGGFFGITSFLFQRPYFSNTFTMQDCILYAMTFEMMQEIVQQEPDFTFHIMRAMGQKVRLLTFQVEYLSFFNTRKRLIALLLSLLDIYGVPCEEGTLLNMRITDQELGSLLGLRREAVTKVITLLRNEGLLLKKDRMLIIPSPKALCNYLENAE